MYRPGRDKYTGPKTTEKTIGFDYLSLGFLWDDLGRYSGALFFRPDLRLWPFAEMNGALISALVQLTCFLKHVQAFAKFYCAFTTDFDFRFSR